jgi:2-keto-3-deoxy-L-rhamnonate aldolase RhmA
MKGGRTVAEPVTTLQEPLADPVRGVQVEDQGGLRALDEILAVDGPNAVFIGTGDLALSSGQPADHPENQRLIDRMLAACGEAGVPCGTAGGKPAAAAAAAARGFRFLMVSNDATMFATAARNVRAAIEAT